MSKYVFSEIMIFELFILCTSVSFVEDCQNVNCPHNTVCLLVKNSGEPFCFPKKRCDAKLDPEPVCGTDGVTYENICAMRLSPDNRGRTAELAHKGPCGKILQCKRKTKHEYFVCFYFRIN